MTNKGISVQIAKGRRNEYSVTSGLKTLAYAEAVIALALNPARQANRLADMFGAQLAAGMGAIGVHDR